MVVYLPFLQTLTQQACIKQKKEVKIKKSVWNKYVQNWLQDDLKLVILTTFLKQVFLIKQAMDIKVRKTNIHTIVDAAETK